MDYRYVWLNCLPGGLLNNLREVQLSHPDDWMDLCPVSFGPVMSVEHYIYLVTIFLVVN